MAIKDLILKVQKKSENKVSREKILYQILGIGVYNWSFFAISIYTHRKEHTLL